MPTWTKEQSEAISKSGSNIIVSAGAGSGKTAVLSERVIYKIQNGIHVNELLILTFTKAAANEMKDRIRKKIKKYPEFKEEENLLSSSYITTFDSFALSVVKKYHYLLNLPKDISLCDESIVKLEEKRIFNEVFDSFYVDNSNEFLSLIKNFCIKNDKLLRESILKVCTLIDKYIDRDEYIDNIKNNFFSDENIDNIIFKYSEFINEKIKNIKTLLNDADYYFESEYVSKLNESLTNILNTNANELHLYSKISLPRIPNNTSDEAKEYKNELKKYLDELISYGEYGDYENIKNSILSSKNMIEVILAIANKYYEKLSEYKSKNNIFTFKDIAFNAIKIVKNFESARNELKYSFKEIMIDEYQDTNDVQDTFIHYIENNNVYMVGDIKQSIYRFNGSNPNIFMDKYNNYSKGVNGYKIDLIKNFRSRSEVLDNINRIFELIMDLNIGGASYKESHEMIFGNTSYNEIRDNNFDYNLDIYEYDKNDEYSNEEIEIFSIANDIKNKLDNNIQIYDKDTSILRNAKYSDFVIIIDRSKQFDDFKKIFEYLGIPLTILRNDKLNTSIDINIIKNIVDIILRIKSNDYGTEFKYDFVSLGRSFLYELTDEEIFEYFYNNNFKDSKIYNDFSKIDSIDSMTCSELFELILKITDFYNKIYKVGDYENTNVRIKTLYTISSNLNNLGYSISEFRDYLDNIITNGIDIQYESYNDNSDSVKIMTIHKSKGLEYPICYFALLDQKFNVSDLKEKFILDKKYGIIIPSCLEDENNTILKLLYKNAYMKEEISEKIRLFYVALTRAREKMIMFIPKNEIGIYGKNDNGVINDNKRLEYIKLSDMIYSIKKYLPSYFKDLDIEKIGLTKKYLYKKQINNKIKTSDKLFEVNEIKMNKIENEDKHFSKENINLLSNKEIELMNFGTKVHEVFEYIDLKNPNYELISDEFIKNKVKRFIESDLLRNINESNIYHEYEFIYEEDNIKYHGIIDLMLEYDDHIDIIDFKLKNIDDENYKKQLNGYKKYIEKISSKNTNIYLYSILDEKYM